MRADAIKDGSKIRKGITDEAIHKLTFTGREAERRVLRERESKGMNGKFPMKILFAFSRGQKENTVRNTPRFASI
jgi:hypothetical protein